MKELCRKHGFSEASYYLWRGKFGGMEVSDAKRLKAAQIALMLKIGSPYAIAEVRLLV